MNNNNNKSTKRYGVVGGHIKEEGNHLLYTMIMEGEEKQYQCMCDDRKDNYYKYEDFKAQLCKCCDLVMCIVCGGIIYYVVNNNKNVDF